MNVQQPIREKPGDSPPLQAFRRRLPEGLYCLTSEEHSRGRSNLEVVAAMIEAGVKVIQYREKDKMARHKYEECLLIREMTRQAGVTFIVNDDIATAILVSADGVHIGQEDLPLEQVRRLVGEDMIIGLSTHSPEQVRDAIDRGADYIGVGPVFPTATKKDVGQSVGLEFLAYVAANFDLPFVAIGGINENNAAEVVRRGAKSVAMISDVVGAEDIVGKIKAVQKVIRENMQHADMKNKNG